MLDILNIFEIAKLQLSELAYKHNFRDINAIHNYEIRSKTNKNLFLPRVNLNYGQFGVKTQQLRPGMKLQTK